MPGGRGGVAPCCHPQQGPHLAGQALAYSAPAPAWTLHLQLLPPTVWVCLTMESVVVCHGRWDRPNLKLASSTACYAAIQQLDTSCWSQLTGKAGMLLALQNGSSAHRRQVPAKDCMGQHCSRAASWGALLLFAALQQGAPLVSPWPSETSTLHIFPAAWLQPAMNNPKCTMQLKSPTESHKVGGADLAAAH